MLWIMKPRQRLLDAAKPVKRDGRSEVAAFLHFGAVQNRPCAHDQVGYDNVCVEGGETFQCILPSAAT